MINFLTNPAVETRIVSKSSTQKKKKLTASFLPTLSPSRSVNYEHNVCFLRGFMFNATYFLCTIHKDQPRFMWFCVTNYSLLHDWTSGDGGKVCRLAGCEQNVCRTGFPSFMELTNFFRATFPCQSSIDRRLMSLENTRATRVARETIIRVRNRSNEMRQIFRSTGKFSCQRNSTPARKTLHGTSVSQTA